MSEAQTVIVRDRRAGPRRWTRSDTVAIAGVTAFGALLRAKALARPGGLVFDEYYAADGCWYFRHSAALCHTSTEISVVHPPLAKWLIGLGVELLGYTPRGWRIASLAAGTLTIALVYLLAWRLLRSTWGAVFASGLLVFDFLHFVFSRTAMLDVFVTLFATAAFLFAVIDRDRPEAGGPSSRRWLAAAGLAGGAAVACKWSGLWMLAGIVALVCAWDARRLRAEGVTRAHALRQIASPVVAWLGVLPVSVYVLTFVGPVHGSLFRLPWSHGAWLRVFLARQRTMFDQHYYITSGHPYSSRAWSWLLLKRPLAMYFAERSGGRYQEVLGLGNPLAWWAAILALVALAVRMGRHRVASSPELVIWVGFFAGYAPWLLIDRGRGEDFVYYLLPAVPFMCLALAAVAVDLSRSAIGKTATAVFAAAVVGLFVFYYPVLTAEPVSYPKWEARVLFRDCGPGEQVPAGQSGGATRLRPVTRAGLPKPTGWCWV